MGQKSISESNAKDRTISKMDSYQFFVCIQYYNKEHGKAENEKAIAGTPENLGSDFATKKISGIVLYYMPQKTTDFFFL